MFSASTPAIRQGFSWDCAAASLAWVLTSAGSPTDEATAISILGSNVNPSVGLTDASGSGIVSSLAAQGIAATNGGLGFDDAKSLAGSVPLMIGGAAFNHWTGVSGVDGDSLVLANPAPGFKGVGDRLSRAQFAALGPFSGVWLTGVAVGSGGPSIAGIQFNPWLLIGAAVAVVLLVDDGDVLPNPSRKPSGGGFDAWQPDLFGGRGKERGEGKTRAQQMGFAREEMRDTGSPSLFESIFGAPAKKPRRRNPDRAGELRRQAEHANRDRRAGVNDLGTFLRGWFRGPKQRKPQVRRNIDAFYGAGGVIHPIRGSEGYDPEVEHMQGEAKLEREQADRYRGIKRERDTSVDRPPWAAGLTNGQLERIAKQHGTRASKALWWEEAGLDGRSTMVVGGRKVAVPMSGELRDLLREGGYREEKTRKGASAAEGRRALGSGRLTAAQRRTARGDHSDLPF